MSEVTDRINAYLPKRDGQDALIDVLRTMAAQLVDLSKAVDILADFDGLRAERIKDLSARIDQLELEL